MTRRTSSRLKALAFATLAAVWRSCAGGEAQAQSGNANAEDAGGDKAVELRGAYFGDGFADIAGGERQGATYVGRLGVILQINLDDALGWSGATFHVSGQQIHGHSLTSGFAGALNVISGLEAEPSTRLNNLWVEQTLGSLAIRVGQFQASQEFLVSAGAAHFINATFGWPTIAALDLPSGGASYPIPTAGVRVSWKPDKQTTALAAVFNGDPAGPGGGDPQVRDASGLNSLRVSGPPFIITEIMHGFGGSAESPTTTLHAGAWAYLGCANDQRRTADGASLSDPTGSSIPACRHRNYEGYAIIDRAIGNLGAGQVSAFARVALSPADRNLVDTYADGGFTWTGALRGRSKDVAGIAIGYAHLSDGPASISARSGARPGEAVAEIGYTAKLTKGLTLHPDVQYVVHPDGAYAAGAIPAHRTADALVIGLRTVARF